MRGQELVTNDSFPQEGPYVGHHRLCPRPFPLSQAGLSDAERNVRGQCRHRGLLLGNYFTLERKHISRLLLGRIRPKCLAGTAKAGHCLLGNQERHPEEKQHKLILHCDGRSEIDA